MTPDEKKLYALMAVAEQQQNLVNQAVKELNRLSDISLIIRLNNGSGTKGYYLCALG